LFAVSDEYLIGYDRKRVLADPNAAPGRNLNRKRQLQRYNSYKEDLRKIALERRFVMPHGYFAIWFYIPIPKSWRPAKVKEMLYSPHQSTPDCDNMIKSFLDGIMPRRNKAKGEKGMDDRKVHCYAAFKMWVKPEEAGVKILEYDDIEFMKTFEHGLPF
jgi:Holliday junction resolvase RusA-like endonuclease